MARVTQLKHSPNLGFMSKATVVRDSECALGRCLGPHVRTRALAHLYTIYRMYDNKVLAEIKNIPQQHPRFLVSSLC